MPAGILLVAVLLFVPLFGAPRAMAFEMFPTDQRSIQIASALSVFLEDEPGDGLSSREWVIFSLDGPMGPEARGKIEEAARDMAIVIGLGGEEKELLALLGVGGSSSQELPSGSIPVAWYALQRGGWYSGGLESVSLAPSAYEIAQVAQRVVGYVRGDAALVRRHAAESTDLASNPGSGISPSVAWTVIGVLAVAALLMPARVRRSAGNGGGKRGCIS